MEKNSMTDATINLIKNQDRKGIFILDGWVREFAYNLRGKPDTDMRLFLSQLLYWFEPRGRSEATGEVQYRANLVRGGDTWVVKSIDDWCEELGVTAWTVKRILNDLEDMHLIKKETHMFRGMRCLHVTFNWSRLDYYMHKYTQTADLPGCDDSELEVVETKSNASKNKPKKAKNTSKEPKNKSSNTTFPKVGKQLFEKSDSCFSYSTETYYRDLKQKTPLTDLERSSEPGGSEAPPKKSDPEIFDQCLNIGDYLFGYPGFETNKVGARIKSTMRKLIKNRKLTPELMEAIYVAVDIPGVENVWDKWSVFIFDLDISMSSFGSFLDSALHNPDCLEEQKQVIRAAYPDKSDFPEFYEGMEDAQCSRI